MDVITTHINADFDALASMVAARKLYPDAVLVLPGSQERNVREFLSLCGGIIQMQDEREVDLKKVRRLIIVETRQASRIGRLEKLTKKRGIEIHVYDHHPRARGDLKAKLDVYKNVGATTTILAGLLKKKRIEISPLEATAMALGIYEDTGSLTFPSTRKEDIGMAGFLLSRGANLNMVLRYLRRELTPAEMALLATLLKSTGVYKISGVDVAISAIETKGYVPDLAILAHKLMDVENFSVLFVIAKTDGRIQFIARSHNPMVDAGRVAGHFGGGGHAFAGSGIIREGDIRQAKDELLRHLKRSIRPMLYAENVMTSPVKTVSQEQKVVQVRALMAKHGLDSMPVTERGRLVGMVHAVDLDKAIHHGFGHSRIKGYMSTKVSTVTPRSTLGRIQDIIYKERTPAVPVLREDKLIGVVSRNNLLGALHAGILKKPLEKEAAPMNVSKHLNSSLPPKVVRLLKRIGRIAAAKDFKAFVVGGFVRDLLLGVRNLDVDIAVERDAIEFARIFAKETKGDMVFHKRFGTASVALPDGFKVDFATARTEYYEYPAALPTVEFAPIKQDLFRRDFTINAMAVHLNPKEYGRLIDFYGGIRDLKSKKIRALHNLSFVEDPTRIFRAVRFEQRYGFRIEPHTEHLIKTAAGLDMFGRTQKQRIRDEIILILKEPNPLKCVARMAELHELRFLHPKIKFTRPVKSLFASIEEVHAWYKLSFFEKRELDLWLIYLAALLEPLSRKDTAEFVKSFVFTRGDALRILSIKEKGTAVLRALKRQVSPSGVYRVLQPLSYEAVLYFMAKSEEKAVRHRISDFLGKYNAVRIAITGKDLKSAGFVPGPHFREMLQKALYAKLDGKLRTKRDELAYVLRLARRM